jgi:hypothetical protein
MSGKLDTYEKYMESITDLPQRALLTAWDCLEEYQDDLVLAGGLAVRHLTRPPEEGLPGPVTLDVDFAIRIFAGGGMSGSIRYILGEQDFEWVGQRFRRKFEELDLYIDLLTDDGIKDSGTVIVDDSLAIGTLPGMDRALEINRPVEIKGMTLTGEETTQIIAVAEVGPMLALKLNAYGGVKARKAPKDAHDILYLAMNYLDGTDRAIAAYHEERSAGNRAIRFADGALRAFYKDENDDGPMDCAAFRLNNRHLDPEFEEESMQIRQQCVTLALALLS